jgi:methyl-accepting chemotaxis protein
MAAHDSVRIERRRVVTLLLALGVMASGGAAVLVHAKTGSLLVALAVHAVGTAVAFALFDRMSRAARSRLDALREALDALAQGDTTVRLDEASGDLGAMSARFNRVCEALARAASRIVDLSRRFRNLPAEISEAISEVERGVEDQEASVEETASLLANINTSIRGINSEVESLARANEETAASIQQMGSTIEQVASGAHELQQTVEASTASIHQMGTSIRRVAESSDEVLRVAEETATATTEMDRAIQEVGEHVRGASDLTQRVSERADEGSQAVDATISGIAAIRDQTLEARQALEGLAERISEIGEIATVIGGISDETNLLSLNAAIIAAQAGDHGKAFAVVADQVKTLAQRTNMSAKQIGEMIRAVQDESANAVGAMGTGIERVEEGVERSRIAGAALEVIRGSAADANGQVAEIARATEEQSRNSKHVAEAAQRVSTHVQQINHAMTEQSHASETLLRNANTYLDMCRQMTQAMEEQRATGRYITGNSQSITEMIRSIQSNTAGHAEASNAVAERFEGLLETAHRSAQRIPDVARVVMELQREAEAARMEAARYDSSGPDGSD